jgi:hypothetical protein
MRVFRLKTRDDSKSETTFWEFQISRINIYIGIFAIKLPMLFEIISDQ